MVGCYIDDLLFAGSSEQECRQALDTAIAIMARLGIPANEKTVLPKSPRQGIVFLGIHIRTEDMRFTVAEDTRAYAIDRIVSILQRKASTKGELASVAGVLTWVSFVFLPGRSRRQHIYDASGLGASGKKSDIVPVVGPLQRQLRWWKGVLDKKKFVGSRVWDGNESPKTVLLHSDASGEDGWGACVSNLHVAGPWPEELADASMLFKELLPVVLVLSLLAPVLAESVFGVAVDNTGAAFAVNRLSCKDRLSSRLLQQLSSVLSAAGHTALASHIRRHRNQHADDLSHALFKGQWQRIVHAQLPQPSRKQQGSWFFPFVMQCLETGSCFTGVFRMRKSLFSSNRVEEQSQP